MQHCRTSRGRTRRWRCRTTRTLARSRMPRCVSHCPPCPISPLFLAGHSILLNRNRSSMLHPFACVCVCFMCLPWYDPKVKVGLTSTRLDFDRSSWLFICRPLNHGPILATHERCAPANRRCSLARMDMARKKIKSSTERCLTASMHRSKNLP